MLGGDVGVDSQEGKGSTFTLTLPRRIDGNVEPQPSPRAPVTEAVNRTSSRTVLAIDDDPNVVYLLKENLLDAGYDVIGAPNGEDGLRKARELQPRAITLDIMMPGTDGWQVLHALKTDRLTREIPVILISIVDQKELGFHLGASDCIVKPFERESLIGALGRAAPDSERILVIDDDPNVVDLVRQLLDTERCTIEWARDGVAGLERIAQARPSVILLDLLMPGMDGLTFLDHLQADPVARTIPVVVLTAASLERSRPWHASERVRGLIDKQGLDRDALIREVRRVLPLLETQAPRSPNDLRRGSENAFDEQPGWAPRHRPAASHGSAQDLPSPHRKIEPDKNRACQHRAAPRLSFRRLRRFRAMKTILIVEDGPLNRDLLTQLLEDDYALLIAVDGGAGVAMAASHIPDLILMDLSLPVIDGWEATRRIKANPATGTFPSSRSRPTR